MGSTHFGGWASCFSSSQADSVEEPKKRSTEYSLSGLQTTQLQYGMPQSLETTFASVVLRDMFSS